MIASNRLKFCSIRYSQSPAELTWVGIDTDEESQQSSFYQTTGPENIFCRVDSPTTSLAAGSEEDTEDIQPKTSAENNGWFKRLVRWIADAYHYFFPRVDDQTSTTII